MLTTADGVAAEAPDPLGTPADAPPDAFCVTGTSIGPPELTPASISDRALAWTTFSASERMFAPGRTGTTLVLLAAGWKDRRSAPMADPIADAAGASDQA